MMIRTELKPIEVRFVYLTCGHIVCVPEHK